MSNQRLSTGFRIRKSPHPDPRPPINPGASSQQCDVTHSENPDDSEGPPRTCRTRHDTRRSGICIWIQGRF
ncbi:hypothetical protein BDN71DRAFT_1457148 [Pleurotus eryngii]|uniref:Uncharacterized protein n=1 Tax=Pleurotus eryngii TaxID=5323 RepID=A0A9P6D171_PLEER|nr:hypothetical protein BDN71DRAFT_1457148 [Pleurotus eryngii]